MPSPTIHCFNRRSDDHPKADGDDHGCFVTERSYTDVAVHNANKDHRYPRAHEEHWTGRHEFYCVHSPTPCQHRSDVTETIELTQVLLQTCCILTLNMSMTRRRPGERYSPHGDDRQNERPRIGHRPSAFRLLTTLETSL
jgi:hypothetical protein